jgi:RHS repeat-associated protein
VEYTNNTAYFIYNDHLGSTRLLTNYPTPTVAESNDYYPFGEFNTAPSAVPLKFTADEYDSESASNHTLFRQQFPSQGRWSTPDPADLAAANLAFPQTWNRYAYVGNSPLSLVDPLGLVPNCKNSTTCKNLPGLPDGGGGFRLVPIRVREHHYNSPDELNPQKNLLAVNGQRRTTQC